MSENRWIWEARYIITGLAIRKHLCKYIEAIAGLLFRNYAKLFLWTPIVWYLHFDHEVATSDFNANEPKGVFLQYAYLLVPQLCWYSRRSRRSFDSVSDFAAYFAAAMEIRYLLKRFEYCKLVSNIRFTEVSALLSFLYITTANY